MKTLFWCWSINLFMLFFSFCLYSTNSTARCPEWSHALWAALLVCTLLPLPPAGQMCPLLTAVTPARLCTPLAMPPPGTCTLLSALAGTQSMNTRSIFQALPTSTEKPLQVGPNKPWWTSCLINWKLQPLNSIKNKEEQRGEKVVRIQSGPDTSVILRTVASFDQDPN